MKIIILGAGRVGGNLARSLVSSNYDVCVVDTDLSRLDDLKEKLDLLTIEGHAAEPNSFAKASANEDSVVLALTSNDEVNILACQIAKKLYKVKKTICRFNYSSLSKNLDFFESYIDVAISPEDEVVLYLYNLINNPGATQMEEFANGKVKLISVKARKKGKLVGRELKELKNDVPNVETFIPMIYRKNKPIVPDGETIIKENDEIYFISSSENISLIVDEFRDHEDSYNRIMIVGGGKIGFSLAQKLEKKCKVKIVESDEAQCRAISKELEKTIVLSGSATDEDLLKSENAGNVDVFCALTNDDETNIMSCLLAKKMGAKKTMIILNNPSYLGLVPGFIDIYIAPYRLTVSSVLQDLRDSDVAQDVILKMDTGAEALEGIVHANEFTSDFFGKSIKDLPIPEGASIGAIVRNNNVMMPSSNIDLAINDHLIVFLSDKEQLSKVEQLFESS